MPTVLANIQLPPTSGIPRDVVVNTLTFFTLATTEGAAAEMTDAIEDFFSESYSGTTIGNLISSTVSRTESVLIDYYNLDEPEPRVPWGSGNFTMPAASQAQSLPQEVALCLSFHAEFVSGSPPARRRGRMYVGPFSTSAATSGTGQPARPTSGLINALALAGDALAGRAWAPSTVDYWGVYSRTDETIRPIVGGWVDNEFDTQRRRGRDATDRTIW